MEVKQDKPRELQSMLENVEALFWMSRRKGETARGNLERANPEADLDETEREVQAGLQRLGRGLIGEYFEAAGTGDQGYHATFNGVDHVRSHRERERGVFTIFGPVRFVESVYTCGNGRSVRPLEAMVNLPERATTYFAQSLLTRLNMNSPYEEGRDSYEDFFGHRWSTRTMQEITLETAQFCDSYESSRPSPDPATEGVIGVVSFDGKGIPMVPAYRNDGKTREALLGCTYTIGKQPRDAADLARLLVTPHLLTDQQKDALSREARGQQMEYFGSVERSKEDVFREVKKASFERFRAGDIAQTVCLMDGASVLWRLAKEHFPDAVFILDVMHVLDYLWDAANALSKDEDSAAVLVCAWLTTIFEGGVGRVIGSMRLRVSKGKLSAHKKKAVHTTITYLDNHRDYMRYDQYLEAGYPIASGVIESACGHIVKDRMDKAGTHWSMAGAEAILNLRCIRASDHWRHFQHMRKHHEWKRLYSHVIEHAA